MTLRSHGANNDGVDPESCNYILIENNVFDSGDDCISLKSGRDLDGRTLNAPCQNIVIRNNTFADGHGGIALGSEMSGGIKNVFADDNHFDSLNLTYPLRLKTNARRGGKIENVYFETLLSKQSTRRRSMVRCFMRKEGMANISLSLKILWWKM